jgi:hypothetical protein
VSLEDQAKVAEPGGDGGVVWAECLLACFECALGLMERGVEFARVFDDRLLSSGHMHACDQELFIPIDLGLFRDGTIEWPAGHQNSMDRKKILDSPRCVEYARL